MNKKTPIIRQFLLMIFLISLNDIRLDINYNVIAKKYINIVENSQ